MEIRPDERAGLLIGRADDVQIRRCGRCDGIHRRRHALINGMIPNFMIQKQVHGDFVGRVHDRRRGAAGARAPHGERKARQRLEIRCVEVQPAGVSRKIQHMKHVTSYAYHLWADAHEEGSLRLGLRSGYVSAYWMGRPMSGTPSWAMTVPSSSSTIECTTLSGWMST